MSPREDVTVLREAEARVQTATDMQRRDPRLLSSEAAEKAIEGFGLARQDLEWNVYPTDTSHVVQRMVDFAEKLRVYIKYIDSIGGYPNASQFRDVSLLKQAHETVGLLRKHLKLCELYDASEQVRLTRSLMEQDAELDRLSMRGTETKERLLRLLRTTEESLRRLT